MAKIIYRSKKDYCNGVPLDQTEVIIGKGTNMGAEGGFPTAAPAPHSVGGALFQTQLKKGLAICTAAVHIGVVHSHICRAGMNQ